MTQRSKQAAAAAAAAAAERHLNMAQNKILYQDWDAAMEQCLKARSLCSSFSLCDQTFAIIKVRQNAKLKINGQHDWYAILLIEDHLCHEKFIKISYDYLSKILDPEQNKVRGAKAAFDCVNQAFQVLCDPRKRAFYDETIRNSAEANKITAAQQEVQENPYGKNGIGSSGEIKNHAQQEIEEENPGGSAEMNHAQQQSQEREAGFKSSAELISAQEKNQEKANGKSLAGVAEEEIASGSKQSSGTVSENSPLSELGLGDFCPWQEKDARTFWTTCNHCHEQYEYERVHENKTMGCWNCRNPFVAVPAFKVPLKLFERISPESVGYSASECAILYENIMDAKLGKGSVNKDGASGSRKDPKK